MYTTFAKMSSEEEVDYNSDETVVFDDGEQTLAQNELHDEVHEKQNENDMKISNEVKTIDNKGRTLLSAFCA